MDDQALPQNAAAWGIWTEYTDGLGRNVSVSRDVIAKMLEALTSTDPTFSSNLHRNTFVIRHGEMRIDHFTPRPICAAWDVRGNDGSSIPATVEGDALVLPVELACGVYELVPQLAGDAERPTANLIVAPARAYQGPPAQPLRTWLIAVQLYGIRSHRNWGHGDFGDLLMLLDCAARCGAGGVGLNPLHVLFDDRPGHISPYSPNSRNFIEPLYIDVEAIPEFSGIAAMHLEDEIAWLRGRELVDYPAARSAKFKALRACHAAFREAADPQQRHDFAAFRRDRGPSLRRFASFEVLRRRFKAPWQHWPVKWRAPSDRDLEMLARRSSKEIEFYEYVQWIADRQLAACRARAQQLGLPVGLYLDLAIGVVPDGADAWSNQPCMLRGVTVGAPPDRINVEGQSWGLTTFSPTGLAAARFEPFRMLLSNVMRHAGAIRIDHVLGLNRLFVMPDGTSALDGTYLDFPFEALLALTAEQSQNNRCIVIGEDLGTVPADFRERLARWGLWSYRVMQFERDFSGRFCPPQSYPEDALVTFTTHDLPTFAGWWSGSDMDVRRAIGLEPGDTEDDRERARAALREALGRHEPDYVAVARFLAATPSHIVVIPLEDIIAARDQPNIPGSIDEHPNWRVRPAILIEELISDSRLASIADAMRESGRSCAPASA